jgi:hypothetical protein
MFVIISLQVKESYLSLSQSNALFLEKIINK